ncbi:MAG TPA: substrate-binding domain-containing protein [Candidatus Nanopelagicaceae bacterium]
MLRTRKYIVVATAAALLAAGVSSATAAPAKKLLGIVSITATDAGNARVIKGATAAAKAAGWNVQVVDAQGNAAQANAAIINFASRKASMIFDLVFPTTSLGAGLAAAKAKKIPVATWGGGLGKAVVMTTGDGAPFAGPATKALLAAMGTEGNILALTYRTGQVCRDREAIFNTMLTGKAGITVTKNEVTIPGFLQDGAKYATAWLAGHPAGSGKLAIWGCWEDPTLGAISALKQQGRTDVLTYGINGSSTAIKAVQDGSLTATVYEDGVKEGATMFATTLKAIKAGAKWKPVDVLVPGVLVSASTVAGFIASHPEALK